MNDVRLRKRSHHFWQQTLVQEYLVLSQKRDHVILVWREASHAHALETTIMSTPQRSRLPDSISLVWVERCSPLTLFKSKREYHKAPSWQPKYRQHENTLSTFVTRSFLCGESAITRWHHNKIYASSDWAKLHMCSSDKQKAWIYRCTITWTRYIFPGLVAVPYSALFLWRVLKKVQREGVCIPVLLITLSIELATLSLLLVLLSDFGGIQHMDLWSCQICSWLSKIPRLLSFSWSLFISLDIIMRMIQSIDILGSVHSTLQRLVDQNRHKKSKWHFPSMIAPWRHEKVHFHNIKSHTRWMRRQNLFLKKLSANIWIPATSYPIKTVNVGKASTYQAHEHMTNFVSIFSRFQILQYK